MKVLTQAVQIFMDGDRKVSVNDCAEINRYLDKLLNAEMPFSNQYALEVSSAGMGAPLKLLRQYRNTIGREVNVLLNNGQRYNGILQSVNDNEIVLIKPLTGKKNPLTAEPIHLQFSDIKKTTLEIKF